MSQFAGLFLVVDKLDKCKITDQSSAPMTMIKLSGSILVSPCRHPRYIVDLMKIESWLRKCCLCVECLLQFTQTQHPAEL